MTIRGPLLVLLLAGSIALGGDDIRFPKIVPKADPVPPAPISPSKLSADRLYMIDSDVPLLLFASPTGKVAVTKEEGPIRVRGKFVDGPDKVETRTYKGKFVYTVEGVSAGAVELIAVPVGAKSESEAVRKTIEVVDGTAPIPPPVPVDPDKPAPPEPVKSFRVFLVTESGQTVTAAQSSAIFGVKVQTLLTDLCGEQGTGWQVRDKNTDSQADTTPMKAFWAAAKPLVTTTPCVAAEVNGKVSVHPLTDVAQVSALLKKLAGGK